MENSRSFPISRAKEEEHRATQHTDMIKDTNNNNKNLLFPVRRYSCNEGFGNLKSSREPARILFFRNNMWTDFAHDVLVLLTAAFLAGKASAEVFIDGERFFISFFHLLQISLATGFRNSIAWIDVDSRCFFPQSAVDDRTANGSDVLKQKPEEPSDRTSAAGTPPPKLSLSSKRWSDSLEEQSVESPLFNSDANPDGACWPGTMLLNEEDRDYKAVESLFYTGIRNSSPEAVVTSIYKCLYVSRTRSSRLKAFEMQMQAVETARKNANVKLAWYGASAGGIVSVIEHGFGQPNNELLGQDARGIGIHLSPRNSPYASSLLSEADDNGERHVILCRVIMGKVEEVPAGSRQFHPSSSEFDNGIDNRENPKWFVVWATHMNMHILPEYVVSFKPSKQLRELVPKRTSSASKLSSIITFPELFAVMGTFLSSQQMKEVERNYHKHKGGKINKHAFISQLRSIAGDTIIRSSIKTMQGRVRI